MSRDHLQDALRLRTAGEHAAALALLAALNSAYPEDARIAYEFACCFDVMGDEQGAIPHYERALTLGLSEPERRGALLGLGSSYRCVGQYDEAIATFDRAIAAYSDGREFTAFRALALYNTGRHREATGDLLRLLADTAADPQLQRYARALRYYADHPDETW